VIGLLCICNYYTLPVDAALYVALAEGMLCLSPLQGAGLSL
jgi:hypothetical protein